MSIFRKKMKLEKSSTSDMLKGLVFQGRQIKEVLKTSDDQRVVRFIDGTSTKVSKDEIIALARVKGSMIGEEKSKLMTPWERMQRMNRGLRIKESQIKSSPEGRKRFIKIRNLAGKMAEQVEGAPEVRFEKVGGVKVPVVAHYYSKEKPDIKEVLQRVKSQYGPQAYRRLKQILRDTGNISKAMDQLLREMGRK